METSATEKTAPMSPAAMIAADLVPCSVRLDLKEDPEFVKKYGKKVKAAGGTYSTARVRGNGRYVTLPTTERELAAKIWKDFGGYARLNSKSYEKRLGCIVIHPAMLGYHGLPAWTTVHHISLDSEDPIGAVILQFAVSILSARGRGISEAFRPFTNAEVAADEVKKVATEEARLAARRAAAREVVSQLKKLAADPEALMTLENTLVTGEALLDCDADVEGFGYVRVSLNLRTVS